MDLDIHYPAVSDLRERARRRVPHFVFEYLDSATGIEDQHHRNREALRAIQFWPGILKGTVNVDLSTRFLDRDYPMPFGCAPVGMSGIMWPGAEKKISTACAAEGIPYCMSNVATVTPEVLTPTIGDQGWFQLYTPANREVRNDMMRRAREAGFHTLVVTVDVPAESRRERQRRADLTIPPKLTPRMLLSMARCPAWALGTLREGRPSLKFCEEYWEGDSQKSSVAHAGIIIRGDPHWDMLADIRDQWKGPMLVKGVQRPEDAQRLVKEGIDGIWVSNHTGRQFDGGPACIDTLPAIRAALPDTPIIYDSGVTGGLDILRALAKGADFVMLGRAFHYAVGAFGAKGPGHLIHILREDMVSCMGQMGVEKLSDLAGQMVET